MGSFAKESKDLMTQTSTPKSMEEVATKVMQVDKVVELFQTMAIVSINMGNLILEVNSLKNRLATGKKEKAIIQEELDKERNFQKGYKINLEIQRKNRVEVEQKVKVIIKKLHDENDELKGSTTRLKLHDEQLQNLKQKVEIWETIERKWIEALFFHKKQHEALDS